MEIALQDSLSRADLFEKFKQQLVRDFEMSGYSAYIPEIASNAYMDVYDALFNAVLKVDKLEHNGLMNLLYRVDISEQQMKQASLKEPAKSVYQIVSELIIKRVLQKVIIKQQFSRE